MKTDIKILAGITNDNELYFLELSNKDYFSMSGFTVRPLELEEAKEQSRESIKNLIEEETEDISGLYLRDIDDITQDIIDSDGNLSGLDTSLYPETVTMDDGTDYIFVSGSCSQHQETELKHYFFDKTDYAVLMSIWNKYHLKDNVNIEKDFSDIEKKVFSRVLELGYFKSEKTQDTKKLIKEAINIINNND